MVVVLVTTQHFDKMERGRMYLLSGLERSVGLQLEDFKSNRWSLVARVQA